MTGPRFKLKRLSPLALALLATNGWAAINCSVSTTGFTSVYSTSTATANDSTGSTTLNCTRLSTDATSLTYRLRVNNGLNSNAPPTNRARIGATASYINYELYNSSTYATVWGNTNATQINGSLSFGTSLSASNTLPFYARIPAAQAVAVTITPRITVGATNTTLTTVALPVSIVSTSSCQFTSPPSTVSFAYTSFQAAAAAASTPYTVRCSNTLPYTMALNATTGTLLGLNYTLAVSSASATGTGLPQNYTVNGSIAAGQAGTCATASCNATQAHVLTITY
jgi:spore coat protein U-like protein